MGTMGGHMMFTNGMGGMGGDLFTGMGVVDSGVLQEVVGTLGTTPSAPLVTNGGQGELEDLLDGGMGSAAPHTAVAPSVSSGFSFMGNGAPAAALQAPQEDLMGDMGSVPGSTTTASTASVGFDFMGQAPAAAVQPVAGEGVDLLGGIASGDRADNGGDRSAPAGTGRLSLMGGIGNTAQGMPLARPPMDNIGNVGMGSMHQPGARQMSPMGAQMNGQMGGMNVQGSMGAMGGGRNSAQQVQEPAEAGKQDQTKANVNNNNNVSSLLSDFKM